MSKLFVIWAVTLIPPYAIAYGLAALDRKMRPERYHEHTVAEVLE